MSFLRKNTALLGISLLAALAVAVGCSREGEEEAESASSDIIQSQDLVISQVYGGGGNSGAVYTHDFIELFNKSAADVSLDGKAVQYAPSTGNFSGTKNVVKLTGTLKARQYFVIQLASTSTATTPAVGDPLPKADYVATQPDELIAMSKEQGKIALTTVANLLDACGKGDAPCDQAKLDALIDFVGFGGANQFEGVATPALGSEKAAVRRAGGCADTGVNGSDFEILPPAPHMTDSPSCDTVDASVPPPPPPADAAAPRPDAGPREAGAPKEAGATTKRDAGDQPAPKTTGGDDDDDDVNGEPSTSSGSVSTRPSKTATPSAPGAPPPQFGATAPDACSMTAGPTSSHAGFAGLFGLALATAALRRRRNNK